LSSSAWEFPERAESEGGNCFGRGPSVGTIIEECAGRSRDAVGGNSFPSRQLRSHSAGVETFDDQTWLAIEVKERPQPPPSKMTTAQRSDGDSRGRPIRFLQKQKNSQGIVFHQIHTVARPWCCTVKIFLFTEKPDKSAMARRFMLFIPQPRFRAAVGIFSEGVSRTFRPPINDLLLS